jgi:hypothetical protein
MTSSLNQTDSGWRKRQIALGKKAENARELGLDYEPSMTKDEALKLALEALENISNWLPTIGQKGLRDYEADAITAIKEALAQPEQKEKFCDSNCVWTDHHPDCNLAQPPYRAVKTWHQGKPVYVAQPAPVQPVAWVSEFVGLTEQERNDMEDLCEMTIGKFAFDVIEAKLKEKNT